MENLIKIWMIWGENPYFWETPNWNLRGFFVSPHPRSRVAPERKTPTCLSLKVQWAPARLIWATWNPVTWSAAATNAKTLEMTWTMKSWWAYIYIYIGILTNIGLLQIIPKYILGSINHPLYQTKITRVFFEHWKDLVGVRGFFLMVILITR